MPVNRDNLKEIVDNAWVAALESTDSDIGNQSTQLIHKKRSARWVDALARQFEDNYALKIENNYTLKRRHRVFWKGNECNRKHFKVNELLFDITVCSVSTTPSLQSKPQDLEFITDCHWQVESEFAKNTRDVIVDMSKLVLGSAENKLIVAAQRDDEGQRNVLAQCADIAMCCRTNVFFLFVSHPEAWEKDPRHPFLFEWVAGDWRQIDSQSD